MSIGARSARRDGIGRLLGGPVSLRAAMAAAVGIVFNKLPCIQKIHQSGTRTRQRMNFSDKGLGTINPYYL